MSVSKKLGLTKGVVIDIEDPAGFKRIKVRIPEIHGPFMKETIPDNMNKANRVADIAIPWAEVNYPYGSDITPELNQVVLVGFISGDPQKPVVLGWLGYEYNYTEDDKKLQPVS